MNTARALIRRTNSMMYGKILTESEASAIPNVIKKILSDKNHVKIMSGLILDGLVDYVHDDKGITEEEAQDIITKSLTEDPNNISNVPMKYRYELLKEMPELFFVRRNRSLLLYPALIGKFPEESRLEIAKNNLKEFKYMLKNSDEVLEHFTDDDSEVLKGLL